MMIHHQPPSGRIIDGIGQRLRRHIGIKSPPASAASANKPSRQSSNPPYVPATAYKRPDGAPASAKYRLAPAPPSQKKEAETDDASQLRNQRHHARAAANPLAANRHRTAQQHGHCRINRHRIIFLRRRKRKEHHHETNPAQRQQRRARLAVQRTLHPKWQLENSRQINAPREKTQQMKAPKQRPGNGVVITRITHIQEAQQLLIHEIKPEEAVILTRHAAHGKHKIRRIAQRSQHMPRQSNQQNNQRAAQRPKPLPRPSAQQLPRACPRLPGPQTEVMIAVVTTTGRDLIPATE